MQAGDADQTPAAGGSVPPASPPPSADGPDDSADATPEDDPTPAAQPAQTDSGAESLPVLPGGATNDPRTIGTTEAQARHGSATWYRSNHERVRSVRRRANPWYRRFGRYLVAATVLAALAVGLYFGALLVQDYLERDRLPGSGEEVPEIRDTSFLVRSGSPAPEIDGTLRIDPASGAFEFDGRNGGPQTGIQAVSPDGATTYIRNFGGEWVLMVDNETPGIRRDDLLDVVGYLQDDDNADAILTSRLRRGYVELVEQETEGTGDDELTSYVLELNTLEFSADYPLQWRDFRDKAIPGVPEERALTVVIWLDTEGVLVRVRDERTNWSWQRLNYSNVPFTPADPASTLLEATTDESVEGAETTD